ncbi:MAG: tRNA (adenosine(37)-N6)-threonylcarbamoyltransferase complex transferase subunit TsaD, partial [Gammaproteobacteria bacterium]
DTLVIKCRRALEHTGLHTLIIAGGVSANQYLRKQLGAEMEAYGGRLYYADFRFCTDNGAMIAYAGCQRLLAGQSEGLEINARPRWSLESLPELVA